MLVILFIAVIGFVAWGIYANSQKQSNLPPQSSTRYPQSRPIDPITTEPPITIEAIVTEPPITIDVEESDDIEASLKKLIEDDIKDQVSGESFKPGERIYFCNMNLMTLCSL